MCGSGETVLSIVESIPRTLCGKRKRCGTLPVNFTRQCQPNQLQRPLPQWYDPAAICAIKVNEVHDSGTRLGKAWPPAKGWFHEPTIFTDVDPKMRIAREEIFGPVISVIPFDTFDRAIEITNAVNYGLSAAIYTRNVNNAFRAQRDIETGIVYINAPTIGAETHLPFGGIKNTGNGHRESGEAALDFYTEWKTIYIDYSDRLQRAQIDNA